jgi:hypothetical protein
MLGCFQTCHNQVEEQNMRTFPLFLPLPNNHHAALRWSRRRPSHQAHYNIMLIQTWLSLPSTSYNPRTLVSFPFWRWKYYSCKEWGKWETHLVYPKLLDCTVTTPKIPINQWVGLQHMSSTSKQFQCKRMYCGLLRLFHVLWMRTGIVVFYPLHDV